MDGQGNWKTTQGGPVDRIPWLTVVGVVGDVRQAGLCDPRMEYVCAYAQDRRPSSTSRYGAALREIQFRSAACGGCWSVDKDHRFTLRTMDQVFAAAI